MRFEEVLSRYQSGRLSCDEAADVLAALLALLDELARYDHAFEATWRRRRAGAAG
jgi:hypothetical protein